MKWQWISTAAAATAAAALVTVLAWPSRAAKSPRTGQVRGVVSFEGQPAKAAAGVVVFLDGVPSPAKRSGEAPPAAHEVSQRDKQFTPRVTVARKGDTVAFPNEDKIFHNVFSVSRAARFDLGLYKSGESKSVKLRREGVVDVYCNIHPEMVATIKVVDSDFYAMTGDDGSFLIEDVPPGTYPIVAWQPHGEGFEGKVEVTEGGTARVRVTLEPGNAPKRHLRKDGTPYGRYK